MTEEEPPSLPPMRPEPPRAQMRRDGAPTGIVTSGHDRSVYFAAVVALLLLVAVVVLAVIAAKEASRSDLGGRISQVAQDLREAAAPDDSTPTAESHTATPTVATASSPIPGETSGAATAAETAQGESPIVATAVATPTLPVMTSETILRRASAALPYGYDLGSGWEHLELGSTLPPGLRQGGALQAAPCLTAMGSPREEVVRGRSFEFYQEGTMGWGCAIIVVAPFPTGPWAPNADPGNAFTQLGSVAPGGSTVRLVNVDWDELAIDFTDGMLTGTRSGRGILTRGEGPLHASITYCEIPNARGVVMLASFVPDGSSPRGWPTSTEVAAAARADLLAR